MKALLGAGGVAVIAAATLAPAAHAQAQMQPSYTTLAPQTGNQGALPQGAATPARQPQPYGAVPQQNAYVQPQSETTQPSQFHQSNPPYPGPRLN